MFVALTDCVSNKINGEWNPILILVAIVNQRNFGHGKKTKASSSPSSFLLSYMDSEVWGCSISRDSWINIKTIENFGTLILDFRIFLFASSSQVDNLYLLLLQLHFVSYSREHE
jgi:hypothetical protein